MTVLVPTEGLETLAHATVRRAFRVALYANDRTPDRGDSLEDYELVDGTTRPLDAAAWVVEATDGGYGVVARHPPQVWRFDAVAVGPVYGYVVLDPAGQLLWAERFHDGPYLIERLGDDITLTLEFALRGTA